MLNSQNYQHTTCRLLPAAVYYEIMEIIFYYIMKTGKLLLTNFVTKLYLPQAVVKKYVITKIKLFLYFYT